MNNNFASSFASVEQAYNYMNPLSSDQIKFDVVSTYQNVRNLSFSESITIPASNVEKKYLGIVTVNPKLNGTTDREVADGFNSWGFVRPVTEEMVGYDYTVYKSSNTSVFSPDKAFITGCVNNCNTNTFSFPIDDINEDYFIIVNPKVLTKSKEKDLNMSYYSCRENEKEENTFLPKQDIKEKVDIKPALFRIFYTKQVMKSRKEKQDYLKKSKETKKNLFSSTVPGPIDMDIVMQQRDDDLRNIEKYHEEMNKSFRLRPQFKLETVPPRKVNQNQASWCGTKDNGGYRDCTPDEMNEIRKVHPDMKETEKSNESYEREVSLLKKMLPGLIDLAADVTSSSISHDDKKYLVESISGDALNSIIETSKTLPPMFGQETTTMNPLRLIQESYSKPREFSKKESTDAMDELDELLDQLENEVNSGNTNTTPPQPQPQPQPQERVREKRMFGWNDNNDDWSDISDPEDMVESSEEEWLQRDNSSRSVYVPSPIEIDVECEVGVINK